MYERPPSLRSTCWGCERSLPDHEAVYFAECPLCGVDAPLSDPSDAAAMKKLAGGQTRTGIVMASLYLGLPVVFAFWPTGDGTYSDRRKLIMFLSCGAAAAGLIAWAVARRNSRNGPPAARSQMPIEHRIDAFVSRSDDRYPTRGAWVAALRTLDEVWALDACSFGKKEQQFSVVPPPALSGSELFKGVAIGLLVLNLIIVRLESDNPDVLRWLLVAAAVLGVGAALARDWKRRRYEMARKDYLRRRLSMEMAGLP